MPVVSVNGKAALFLSAQARLFFITQLAKYSRPTGDRRRSDFPGLLAMVPNGGAVIRHQGCERAGPAPDHASNRGRPPLTGRIRAGRGGTHGAIVHQQYLAKYA